MDVDIESFIERPPSEEEILVKARGATWRYVALTALVSLLVGVAIGRFGQQPAPNVASALPDPPPGWEQACAEPPSSQEGDPTVAPTPLKVYVSGAVVEPRVVIVPEGSLVADALNAAGGPAPDADLNAINLAAPVADHQQIIIPSSKARDPDTSEDVVEKIDLNTATAELLQTLPGIGASRAEDIVSYREVHGPFQRIEEIQDVGGIGEGIFAQIEPYIMVSTGD